MQNVFYLKLYSVNFLPPWLQQVRRYVPQYLHFVFAYLEYVLCLICPSHLLPLSLSFLFLCLSISLRELDTEMALLYKHHWKESFVNMT